MDGRAGGWRGEIENTVGMIGERGDGVKRGGGLEAIRERRLNARNGCDIIWRQI